MDLPLERFVGKDIMHVAGQDFLLVALPERRIEQVGVVRHEDFAHGRIAEQESAQARSGLRRRTGRGDAQGGKAFLAGLFAQVLEERRHAPQYSRLLRILPLQNNVQKSRSA